MKLAKNIEIQKNNDGYKIEKQIYISCSLCISIFFFITLPNLSNFIKKIIKNACIT